MADYSQMKATKESKSDKLKNTLSEIAGSSSSGTKKSSSTTKSKTSTKSNSTSSAKSSSTSTSTTQKRGRGRPKGSKNKSTTKKVASTGIDIGTLAEEVIKKEIKSLGNDSKEQSKTSSGSSSSKTNKQTTSASIKKVNGTTTRIVKKSEKTAKKVKKYWNLTAFLVVLFLVVGFVGAFFTTKYMLRNDVYEMVAYDSGDIDLVIGEEENFSAYIERGVKCIAFGKDYSKDYIVKYYYRNDLSEDEVEVDSVDTGTAGIYYAVYEVPTIKYKTVKLIRNIIVLRSEGNG